MRIRWLYIATLLASGVALGQYNPLHQFTCSTEGCNPQYPAVLAQGWDGNLYGTMPQGSTYNYGTFFSSTPDGGVTPLYTFDGNLGNGVMPRGGVTRGIDGNFYGTTIHGGIASGHGTIFRITPWGTITTLYSFTNSGGTSCPLTGIKPDGGDPYSAPIQGKDGYFYGVTSIGTAYRISSSGIFKALCTPATFPVLIPYWAQAPVIQASDGNFYGTNIYANGTIFRFSSKGVIKIIYRFNPSQGSGPGPMIQGSDGYLYGTTVTGGPFIEQDSGVIFKVKLDGTHFSVLHAFDRVNKFFEGYAPTAGLVEATDGNLYGSTTRGGDSHCGPYGEGCGVLFKITKSGTGYTPLHTFHYGDPASPQATQIQHTNGKIYGLVNGSDAAVGGELYSIDVGLQPFVRLLATAGKAGQVVHVQGYQLTGTTTVKFGTSSATFSVLADGHITAVVPATGTTGRVTVITPSGTLTSSQQFKVTPVITGFTPTSGPVGSQVLITGTGLTQVSKVTFGGIKAITFTTSATQVMAIVPTGAVTGKIAVTTPGGSASKGTFTVTP